MQAGGITKAAMETAKGWSFIGPLELGSKGFLGPRHVACHTTSWSAHCLQHEGLHCYTEYCTRTEFLDLSLALPKVRLQGARCTSVHHRNTCACRASCCPWTAHASGMF